MNKLPTDARIGSRSGICSPHVIEIISTSVVQQLLFTNKKRDEARSSKNKRDQVLIIRALTLQYLVHHYQLWCFQLQRSEIAFRKKRDEVNDARSADGFPPNLK